MSDEQWLREGLREAVPEPPSVPHRGPAAVSRARASRRRTTALVAAGSVLAVFGIIGTGVFLAGGSDRPAPSDRTSTRGPLKSADCPPSSSEGPRGFRFFDRPQAGIPDAVPKGATSARLCAGNGHPLDLPEDALVEDVGRLVEAVNDLRRAEKDIACTQELGYGYRILFGYPDGSGYQVSGALYGCEFVITGPDQRLGAADLLEEYGDLLRQQRAQRGHATLNPNVVSTIVCDSHVPVPAVATPEDLHVAALCVRTAQGYLKAPVSAAELAVLRDDLQHNVQRVAFPQCPDATELTLVGLTVWGETVALPSVCGSSQLEVIEPWSTANWPRSWLPSQAARQIIDDITSRAR